MVSIRVASICTRWPYAEVESRTQGEESENAVELPASARAPARVWKRMADDVALSPLESWTATFESYLAALVRFPDR